jgi:hypothetical protein
MSSKALLRAAINANLPEGPIWEVKSGGDLDKLLDGIAEIEANLKDFYSERANDRNPFKTSILSDLEKEYGVVRDDRLTEELRRMQLAAVVFAGEIMGTDDDLQLALDTAGFNLLVHVNNPPVDPAIFLTQSFQMVAGGDNAYAGFEPSGGPPSTAFAGRIGGELLVNGELNNQIPAVTTQANGATSFAGNSDAVAGKFDTLQLIPIEYDIPTNPIYWQFVFFVGGVATRDPVTDELTDIQSGEVPTERKQELERLILKFKPLHSEAGMIITYT